MKKAVALLIAALVVTACSLVPGARHGGGPLVVVAGDSQVYFAQHDALGDARHHLTDILVASGYSVSSAESPGVLTYALNGLIRGTKTTWPVSPTISVTDLGVNDISLVHGPRPVPEATSETNLSRYLNAVAAQGARCPVLIEVPETRQWGLDRTGPTWNAFLARQAAIRGGTVVPWARLVAAHPTYVSTADGVHQTSEGKSAFRNAIRLGVQRCS